jgi:hypothetical protein
MITEESRHMRTAILALVMVVAVVGSAQAQSPIPVRYKVTRTAPNQPAVTVVFLKSTMTCTLPKAVPPPGAIRIDDPSLNSWDCEKADPEFFAGMVPEVAYNYTISGQANDVDPYGPESQALVINLPRIPQIPGAPGNLRGTPPGTIGVAALGVVSGQPYKFAGLEVAPVTLDGGAGEVFLGAQVLEAGSFRVKRGDRVSLAFWRER